MPYRPGVKSPGKLSVSSKFQQAQPTEKPQPVVTPKKEEPPAPVRK